MEMQALTCAEVRLPEGDLGPALAREFTRNALRRWGHRTCQDAFHDIVQVVSELVSNVLLHAHGRPFVRLVRSPASVRVEVVDDSPLLTRAGTTGLGLRLVDRVATTWGVFREGRGKVVWCELPVEAG